MKYTSSNKPLVCMQTQSTCYKETSKMTIRGVLWHSTGANNPNLKRYIQPSDVKPAADTYDKAKWLEILGKNTSGTDWNHKERQAGLNCWIGKLADGTVTTVQAMPWDYAPWGCGGYCNDGWIQFEICEDDLSSKDYFNKVYAEACEITAYLCKLYNIDPNGTVSFRGKTVPTILCHADSHKLGLGSNHGDVNHWFPKYGKSMETARADVAALLKADGTTVAPATKTKYYRVRKAKDDSKSQVGAYKDLQNAIDACQKAGEGYHVFDWEYKLVYSYTVPVTLTSIAVTKVPTKTSYYLGESYEGNGLEITATYSDRSTKVITDYKISGFNSAKAGTTTVKVTFEGKNATFTLTIKEPEIVEPDKPVDPIEPDKPVDPIEPNIPVDPVEPDKPVDPEEPDTDDDVDVDDEKAKDLATLIFNVIKKLIHMFANLFNKGE